MFGFLPNGENKFRCKVGSLFIGAGDCFTGPAFFNLTKQRNVVWFSMNKTIIAYSDDEREFICKDTNGGFAYTRNIFMAREFRSIEEASTFTHEHFHRESFTFLALDIC